MTPQRMVIAAAVVLAALVAIFWPAGGSGIAVLRASEGEVTRDYKGAEKDWQGAELGSSFEYGDAIKTGKQGHADLELRGNAQLAVRPDSVIRFLSEQPEQPSFKVETGVAEVSAAEAEITFETAGGIVKLRKGSRIRVREDDDGSHVEVTLGKAEMDWVDTEPQVLAAGESADSNEPEPEPEPEPAVVDAGAPVQPADAGPASAGVIAVVQGKGVTRRVGGKGRAQRLKEGEHEVLPGDAIAVGRGSSLSLSRGDQTLQAESGAKIVVGREGEAIARANAGTVRISSRGTELRLEVAGGVIVALRDDAGGSAGTVNVGRKGAQVQVTRGAFNLEGATKQALNHGESGELAKGGKAAVEYTPPSAADMALPAGESATVHDPAAPTAVRVVTKGKCSGDAAVELEVGRRGFVERGRGADSALVWFAPGSRRYRVRCVDSSGVKGKAVASGKLRVSRDSAVRRLPKQGPTNTIEADGRKYNITYQSHLPALTIHWPGGPASTSTLSVKGPGGAHRFKAPKGRASVKAGALKEGSYTLQFEGGGKKSRTTRLTIRFDNATPAAYLRSRGAVTPGADGAVVLAGAALEGSSVSQTGQRVGVDHAHRFEARIKPGAEDRSVALRITHPRLGVHYYVRRVQGRGD